MNKLLSGELHLVPKCNSPDKRGSYNSVQIEVERASTLTVFETEPLDADDELYYENEQTFVWRITFST